MSIRDLIGSDVSITHRQITDLFLLGLAVHKGGKLATLDQHIPVRVIQNGAQSLELIVR